MDKKKRILIFSTAYLPFVGGAEVAVKEITDRLPEIEFVMITARLDKELKEREKIGNVDVHRIGKGDKWDKFRLIFFGWKKALKLGKFNLVWPIMASYAGFTALRYKKRNKNVPFLLTLQEGDSKWDIYKRVWFIWPYFKQIFKKADKIQAISNYLADWARSLGVRCPVEVAPNGVDAARFSRTMYHVPHVKKEVRELVGINEGDKAVITVSRLVKKNGVEDLIRAMEFFPENVHLLILGEGELERKLKSISDERVHFLGRVNYADLPEYLVASDVFCRPSLSEGLGNAFLEAMAVGVPAVGTKVGGIPDFLVDGQTGWFCEVKNPKSIAEKIKYILDDKNKDGVEEVAKNARKMVEEKYNWDLISQKMEAMFLSLCNQS